MRNQNMTRRAVAAAAVGAVGLTLAACGTDAEPSGTESDDMGAEKGTITLGYIDSWTDGRSTAYLLENKLEAAGYTVEHETITDAGLLYTALSEGDIDIYPSAWPEVTHAQYMDQYGDDIEDLGAYYEGAVLTLAVPEYSKITSIDQLPEFKDQLDGKIIGIEPGSGLAGVVADSTIPEYGLDEAGFEQVTSSTPAMLAELQGAIKDKEEIVVTLWRPFWANPEYNVRDLEDPKGAMGEPEALHFLASKGFSEEFPEAAEFIGGLKLDDAQFGSLEDLVVNENPDDPAAGVAAWLDQNPDVVGEVAGAM